MGQAVAELPDPLEAPPPAAASATDDLISQIAGDEIDRLMAESENGGEVSPAAPVVAEVVAVTPAVEVPATAPSTSEELTNLLDHLSHDPKVEPPAVATPSVESPPVAAAPVAAVESSPEPLMSTAERDALGLADLSDATDKAEHHDAAVIEMKAPRVGLGIRLLELINAPLASVSDSARDAIGKLAIVTLANSIAVLIYVLLFRR